MLLAGKVSGAGYLEIDFARAVGVECAKDVLAEPFRIAVWVELGVHFHELLPA